MQLKNLKEQVRLAIGGDPSFDSTHGVSSDQRIVDVVNEAGRYLFSRRWRFREKHDQVVASVGTNATVLDLPSDFDTLISVRMTNELDSTVELTTPDRINLYRRSTVGSNNQYYVAVYHYPGSVNGQNAPKWQFQVYPSVPTADSDLMRVTYLYSFPTYTTSSDDTSVIDVPTWCESLLIAYCRAFAQGYEDEGLNQRLAEIDAGPLYMRVAEQDGLLQMDYGPLLPQYQYSSLGQGSGFYSVTAAAPSDPNSIVWRGAYSASNSYSKNSLVRHSGNVYIATNDVGIGITPPTSPWDVFVYGA
jgi:hypothetical protein